MDSPRMGISEWKLRAATVLALLWVGCAPWPRVQDAQPCTPHFPFRDGWLGADAVYSIPLPTHETLWLFGDTFVGAPGQSDRVGAAFVHNSIGLSRCDAGRFDVRYHWSDAEDGRPSAFMEHPGEGAWWWLFDGFVHEGRILLGLAELERAPPSGPLALPFRFTGMQLGRVENPGDDPRAWRVKIAPLWHGPFAAGAMAVDGEYLHLFVFPDRGDGRHPRVLARLPLAALAGGRPGASLEHLTADGRWAPGAAFDRGLVLMADDATEMSVRRDPQSGIWRAVYSHPLRHGAPGFDDGIYVRFASRIEGPWSDPVLLLRVPELDPQRRPDPALACYAGKEHAGFTPPGRLLVTYVCNLFTPPGGDAYALLDRLLGAMQLYRPRVTTAATPPVKTASRSSDATGREHAPSQLD